MALIVIAVYVCVASQSTLWDRDETYYARVAVEMVESGDYLVPTFNGKPWLEKPPMLYWFMSIPMRIFGDGEFACRVCSVVTTVGVLVVISVMGRRLFSPTAGLWAMLVYSLSVMTVVLGTLVLADPPLMLFMVLAMAAFLRSLEPGHFALSAGVLVACLAVAALIKGPMVLLALGVMALGMVVNRRYGWCTTRNAILWTVALAGAILAFAAWAMPVDRATQGQLTDELLGRHVAGRIMQPMQHHGGHDLLFLPYYFPVVLLGFFPWTLHLPGVVSAVLGGRVGGCRFRNLFLVWVLTPVILMTLVATKLPHYIFFIWPPLSLALGGSIDAAANDLLSERDRRWFRRGVIYFTPAVLFFAVGLAIVPEYARMPDLRWSCWFAAAIWATAAVLSCRYQLQTRIAASTTVLAIAMAAFAGTVAFGILPAVEHIKIAPRVGQIVREQVSADTPVAVCGYAEPSLNFYIGRPIETIHSYRELEEWTGASGSGLLLITTDQLDRLPDHRRLSPAGSVQGIDYVSGRRLDVRLYLRTNDATVAP